MSALTPPRHEVRIVDGFAVKLPDHAPHNGRMEVWVYGLIGRASVPFLAHGSQENKQWNSVWTFRCQYRIDGPTQSEIERQSELALKAGTLGEVIPVSAFHQLSRLTASFKLKYTIPLIKLPYAERHDAQRLGAFFDTHRKNWCVLRGTKPEPFARWL